MAHYKRVEIVALALVCVVATAQLYRAIVSARGEPKMVSEFYLAAPKCGIEVDRVTAALVRGLTEAHDRPAANGLFVLRSQTSLYVTAAVVNPSDALAERQAKIIQPLVDCGTSAWCEGLSPLSTYGEANRAIVERKIKGEKVKIPDCEVTEADFRLLNWRLSNRTARLDVLSLLALLIDGLTIVLIGWRGLRRKARSAGLK